MTAENHGLTDEELRMAAAFGMDAQEYAWWKTSHTRREHDEFQERRVQDAERERIKAAVREALEERERGDAA